LNDNGDEARRHRGMGDDHGPKAAINRNSHKQKQHGQAGNDLGHHQRRVDHRGEQEPTAKAAKPDQRHRGERAQQRRDASRDKGHPKADRRGLEQRRVLRQSRIPAHRPTTPHRHQARSIE